MKNKSLIYKIAFTLAETLIVMGIIGVVAALTLPNLNSSTGDKEKVAKVKKIYSNLSDAIGRAEAVYGPLDEWCVNYEDSCHGRMMDRITEFMKVTKKCNLSDSCIMDFGDYTMAGGSSRCSRAVIVADGTAVCFAYDHNASRSDSIIKFKIDIDGPNRGQGESGKDTFQFGYNIKKRVLEPLWNDTYMSSSTYVDKEERYFDIDAATTWVINFENLDYLKTTNGKNCPGGEIELSFGGNHSCK